MTRSGGHTQIHQYTAFQQIWIRSSLFLVEHCELLEARYPGHSLPQVAKGYLIKQDVHDQMIICIWVDVDSACKQTLQRHTYIICWDIPQCL